MSDPSLVGVDSRLSLIEKLRQSADGVPGGASSEVNRLLDAIEAEIEQLRTQTIYHCWEPIETAPVPPPDQFDPWDRFKCLIQNSRGEVFEGHAKYVALGKAKVPTLRWYGHHDRQVVDAVYWMPLPVASSKHAPSKP